MFDKRLFKELNNMKSYFIIGTAASIVAVSLTILQAATLAGIINNIFIKKRLLSSFGNSLVLLLIIIATRTLVNGFLEYYNRRTAIKLKGNIRRKLIEALLETGPIKLKNDKPGRLASLMEEGVEAFDPYYGEFIPQMLMVVVAIPMVLFVVIKRDLLSGIIMLFTAPLIPIFMMLIGKMAQYFNKNQWKSLQKMSGHFLDVLKGLSTLRLFGKTKSQEGIIWKVSEGFRENTMGVLKISFLSALVLELVATISTALLSVTLGIRLLYGKIYFNEAFFILLLAPEYYQPLRQLGAKFHAAMGARAAGDSIFPIIEGNNSENVHKVKRIVDKFENIEIDIEKLTFSYDGVQNAIENMNISLRPNNKIAFIGPSGGGKSTLLAIIMGFIEDYQGSIKINNLDLKELDSESWTRNFAYVPQHPRMFKATILENLRIAKQAASLEEVIKVAEGLGIDNFVRALPEGYNTRVGEGGIALSGGQVQLIAIGRAYLKGASLIILDEPTSALDIDTENMVIEALEKLSKGKTTITIAHRIPTIINSDVIYVLEKGRIVEQGKHGELIENFGLYSEFLTAWEGQK